MLWARWSSQCWGTASQICLRSPGFLVFNGWCKQEFVLTVTCYLHVLLHVTFVNVRCICVCYPTSKSLVGVKARAALWEPEGWEGRCLRCSRAAVSRPGRSCSSSVPLHCRQSSGSALCSWAGNWQCLRDETEQKMAFPELCLCPYMRWPRARMETLSS